MDKQQVIRDLVGLLTNYQKQVGEKPQAINPATCPLKDLPHFDSLASVSVTVECLEKYAIKSDKIVSLFFEAEPGSHGGRASLLTVEGVADRICALAT